ncbi:EHD1 [Symbiodinium microadriaticum]|nr:EHD1 [Symbiodinium microadriaticum]
MCSELGQVFRTVMKRHNLAPGDFPDIADFRSKLVELDFSKFAVLKQQLIDAADTTLATDIPRLMEALPRSIDPAIDVKLVTPDFDCEAHPGDEASNPFDEDGAAVWCMEPFVTEFKPEFDRHQQNGHVSGSVMKEILTASNIDVKTLRKIWDLADIDKDGQLDLQEFVIARFLTARVLEGTELPVDLDAEMIPFEKR